MKRTKSRKEKAVKTELIEITPTRTLCVHARGTFTKEIKISDITDRVKESFRSEAFKSKVIEAAKDSTLDPLFIVTRNSVWSRTMRIVEPPAEAVAAEWKLPLHSARPAPISFPADSNHCSHPLEMKSLGFGDKEHFVMNSTEYVWKMDREGKWYHRNFKLVKNFGDRRVVVAKYWEPARWKGAALVVDETEVDVMVAALTCYIMLRKKRQKDAERS